MKIYQIRNIFSERGKKRKKMYWSVVSSSITRLVVMFSDATAKLHWVDIG